MDSRGLSIQQRYTPDQIARAFSNVVREHLIDPNAPSFWLLPKSDRVIISVNPFNVKNTDQLLSDRSARKLSAMLQGVKVVKTANTTNIRGIFFQVGYTPEPPARFERRPMDLAAQPSPLHVPMGVTTKGVDSWRNFLELDSVLIGGPRRMGKTRLKHAWIQALIHGGAADLVLYDGQNGAEFSCYANMPGVQYTANLLAEIQRLTELGMQRAEQYKVVRATNLAEYNQCVPGEGQMRPVGIFVDELPTLTVDIVDALTHLVAWGGKYGILPVVSSQRTGAEEIPAGLKANLKTRICFPVPQVQDSMVVLGHPGAEKLPKGQEGKGRYVYEWEGRLIQMQAYLVELPDRPTITGREIDLARWALEQHNGRMSIPLLVKEQKMAEREARELLDVWQSQGWLLGGGQGSSRRVSPGFESLIRQSVKAVKVSQDRQSSNEGSGGGFNWSNPADITGPGDSDAADPE